MPTLRRFFLRGTGPNAGQVRVRPSLTRLVEYVPLNLMHPDWTALGRFAPQVDAVFCRSVMIYFDSRRSAASCSGPLRLGAVLVDCNAASTE